MKILLFLLPLIMLAKPVPESCKAVTTNKSRIHPITIEEIEKEIENNLHIIEECKDYSDVTKEAELYNEYLMFKYLKLPTVPLYDNKLLERCRRLNQKPRI